jgi:uncharacterized membrane protein YhaH (DUF805 family)
MVSFYKKWRKIFWIVFAINALIAVLQFCFAYSHLVKHDPWLTCLSLSIGLIGLFNTYVAGLQIKRLQDLAQEEKELVFNILSTKY